MFKILSYAILFWSLQVLSGPTSTPIFYVHPQSNSLQVKSIQKGLVCLKEKNKNESANSLLLSGDGQNILIDAGWSDNATVPVELADDIANALKVATHFHFDHIRQWHQMRNIILPEHQAKFCKKGLCAPSRWQTVMPVKSFNFKVGAFDQFSTVDQNPRLSLISCGGHSQTDACFLDKKTRTVFLGDLFYLGPVFYFLPGGNIDFTISFLKSLLARDDWDTLALSHGECASNRASLTNFLEDLKNISMGKYKWAVNFDFWLPLRAYKIRFGYVVTNLFW